MILHATWFRHVRQPRAGLRVTFERAELIHTLRTAPPMRCAKADLPVLCFATFRDDARSNSGVSACHALALDVDTPTATPRETCIAIAHELGGVEVFAYSTASSMPRAFKLRVIVPYSEPVSGDEHRAAFSLASRVLVCAGVEVDRVCSDPARAFFTWCVPASGVYFSQHLSGVSWPAKLAAQAELEHVARERARAAARRPALRSTRGGGDVVERARRYLATIPGAVAGQHGHDATFGAALKLVRGFGCDVDQAFELLASDFNTRCVPPWSARDLRRKVEQASGARIDGGWLVGRAR